MGVYYNHIITYLILLRFQVLKGDIEYIILENRILYLRNMEELMVDVVKKKKPLKNVFVEKIPLDLLFTLLEKICSFVEGRGVEKGIRLYYYISDYEYRKMVFDSLHIDFLNSIRPYYSTFFSRYCDREFTYNAFKTIVRQICKIHGIRHEKQSFVVNSEITVAYCIYLL